MSALNVLSIQDAKQHLRVDFDDDNDLIEDLIKTSVRVIENHTCYRLYQREEQIKTSRSCIDIFQYPLNEIVSVEDKDEASVSYKEDLFDLRTTVYFASCDTPKTMTIDVGYENPADVDPALRDCLKKLVAHFYENRGISKSEIPNDIQMLLAPYRRFTYF